MNLKKIAFLVIISLIIISSCFKKPHWETNITIPLVSKSYPIIDRLDTSYFRINADSSINFFINDRLDTVKLLDSIHIEDYSDSSQTALSNFLFTNLASSAINLTAEHLSGLNLPETTLLIPIPPFTHIIEETLSIHNIQSAIINRAALHLIVNNFSRLTFDSLKCYLSDFETICVPALDSLSAIELSRLVEDIAIDSLIPFRIFLSSSGTGSESILISTYDSMKFTVVFDSVRINSGCFHPNQPRHIRSFKERMYALPLNYQIRISDLVCDSGLLSIHINNNFPISCEIQLTIPELFFDTSLPLIAFDSISYFVDLTNRIYHNTSLESTQLTLRSLVEFDLDTTYISFTPENAMLVRYQLTGIQIESIAGTIIDTITQAFSADTVDISIPNFLNRAQAVHAYAILNITNAVAFPMNLVLNITAKNISGDSTSIDTIFSITPATPTNPQVSTLVMNCTQLFNIHPDFAILNAEISSFGNGWMNGSSYNTADYVITSPLQVVLRADTITYDPDTIKITEDARNTIRNNINSGIFFAHIQNHLPANLSGKLILENLQFDTVQIALTIPSGIVNDTGLVITPADTNLTITLSQQKVEDIFTDSLLKVYLTLYIPDTDTITITGYDYLKIVNSYAKIQTALPPK